MRAIAALGGAALALTLVLACGCGGDGTGPPRVSERERALAADAVEGLRKALNQGTCDTALHDALEGFRPAWMARCSHIREAWGSWKTFRPNYWQGSGNGVVAVEGIAEFAKGGCVVQVVWDVQRDPARMIAFFLSSKQDRVNYPPFPEKRYFDPPPPAGPRVRLARLP